MLWKKSIPLRQAAAPAPPVAPPEPAPEAPAAPAAPEPVAAADAPAPAAAFLAPAAVGMVEQGMFFLGIGGWLGGWMVVTLGRSGENLLIRQVFQPVVFSKCGMNCVCFS